MVKIFLSHASEDKALLVRPLAHKLKSFGLQVWYDEFSLRAGDSLRRSIDDGLSKCSAGIVVLSPSFFSKEWPQRELDALYSAEVSGRSHIIPVWHEIDEQGVASYSPLLADRFAIFSSEGVKSVAEKIASQFNIPPKRSGSDLAEIIEGYLLLDDYSGDILFKMCQQRFMEMNAYKKAYIKFLGELTAGLSDDDLDDFPEDISTKIDLFLSRLKAILNIPDDVYLIADEPIGEQYIDSYLEDIGHWSSGTLSKKESEKLVMDLDTYEYDEYYILLNIPNFSISLEQRAILERIIIEFGCAFKEGYETVEKLCTQLRKIDQQPKKSKEKVTTNGAPL
ncbi:toll/interleukin-1 receptor domain-containing protein [Alcanivorax sp.]|jgi:hypothetical protein|uniref:toll/interleukin-1 receptor domain-containing protein n=1 Tax=Alcanivorax sp. TaxID=1872427 RepID=UPI0025C59917|nr:toll/interleukin-1 receptor domain-containing protein [Alcanivorax sp.]